MVEPHRGYEEQQVEYAQACLDVEKAALGIHSLSMEEQPNPPKPPEPDRWGVSDPNTSRPSLKSGTYSVKKTTTR